MEWLAWDNKKAGDPAGKNIWKSLGLYCENLGTSWESYALGKFWNWLGAGWFS